MASVWTCSRNRGSGGAGGLELMSCTQNQEGLTVRRAVALGALQEIRLVLVEVGWESKQA